MVLTFPESTTNKNSFGEAGGKESQAGGGVFRLWEQKTGENVGMGQCVVEKGMHHSDSLQGVKTGTR